MQEEQTEEQQCRICSNNFWLPGHDPIKFTSCSHSICEACLKEQIKRKMNACPYCYDICMTHMVLDCDLCMHEPSTNKKLKTPTDPKQLINEKIEELENHKRYINQLGKDFGKLFEKEKRSLLTNIDGKFARVSKMLEKKHNALVFEIENFYISQEEGVESQKYQIETFVNGINSKVSNLKLLLDHNNLHQHLEELSRELSKKFDNPLTQKYEQVEEAVKTFANEKQDELGDFVEASEYFLSEKKEFYMQLSNSRNGPKKEETQKWNEQLQNLLKSFDKDSLNVSGLENGELNIQVLDDYNCKKDFKHLLENLSTMAQEPALYVKKISINLKRDKDYDDDGNLRIIATFLETRSLDNLEQIELNFSECRDISDEGLDSLFRILVTDEGNVRYPQLIHLNLNLSNCAITTSKGFGKLCGAVGAYRSNLQLLILNFSNWYIIIDEAVNSLAVALKQFGRQLKSINLNLSNGRSVTQEGFKNLNEAITQFKLQLQHLTLNFLGCPKITDSIIEEISITALGCKKLQSLKLNFSKCTLITEAGINKLADNLEKMQMLTELHLNLNACTKIAERTLNNFNNKAILGITSISLQLPEVK